MSVRLWIINSFHICMYFPICAINIFSTEMEDVWMVPCSQFHNAVLIPILLYISEAWVWGKWWMKVKWMLWRSVFFGPCSANLLPNLQRRDLLCMCEEKEATVVHISGSWILVLDSLYLPCKGLRENSLVWFLHN